MLENLTLLAPVSGVVALLLAVSLFFRVRAQPAGNARMAVIADDISVGSMAFLKVEFGILGVYALVVFGIIFATLGQLTAISFLVGALLSLAAGLAGMKAATLANVRTAEAARSKGRGEALMVAFDGGAVMGLAVAGLVVIGLSALFIIMSGNEHLAEAMHGFGVGASSIALFARIGGGIYTKAADVGADLAGKVIAGIPEDDPRNPGVVADNVGDNVGDVAGMGADIYESYAAALIAAVAIALAAPAESMQMLSAPGVERTLEELRLIGTSLPFVLAGIGMVVSLFAIVALRLFKNASPSAALRAALIVPPFIFIAGSAVVVQMLQLNMGIVVTLALGAIGGGVIGYKMDQQIKELEEQTAGTGVDVSETDGGEAILVNLPDGVTFSTGSYTISPGFRDLLDRVAGSLRQYPNSLIDVYGHTDTTGSATTNQRLSEQRAQAVANYLISQGVSSSRVRWMGFGETRLKVSTGDNVNEPLNRRVEIKIVPFDQRDIEAAQSQGM